MIGYGTRAEYNFFMSLSDMAKLEYMYDYFNLDFGEYESEPTVTFEYRG